MITKIRYVGKTTPGYLTNGKIYDVISIESGWYRIDDDTGEDYLYPSNVFEIVEENDKQQKELYYKLLDETEKELIYRYRSSSKKEYGIVSVNKNLKDWSMKKSIQPKEEENEYMIKFVEYLRKQYEQEGSYSRTEWGFELVAWY